MSFSMVFLAASSRLNLSLSGRTRGTPCAHEHRVERVQRLPLQLGDAVLRSACMPP